MLESHFAIKITDLLKISPKTHINCILMCIITHKYSFNHRRPVLRDESRETKRREREREKITPRPTSVYIRRGERRREQILESDLQDTSLHSLNLVLLHIPVEFNRSRTRVAFFFCARCRKKSLIPLCDFFCGSMHSHGSLC